MTEMPLSRSGGTSGLMRVDARLVREQLVRTLLDDARSLAADGSLELDALEPPLSMILGELEHVPAPASARAVAELGYAARIVEVERFPPARVASAWLAEQLEGASRDSVEEVAVRLAIAEPAERPDPGDGTASWRVPGPGGHVRYYLAAEAAREEDPEAVGRQAAALRRCWMLGFFVRSCEEVRRPQADRGAGGPAPPR